MQGNELERIAVFMVENYFPCCYIFVNYCVSLCRFYNLTIIFLFTVLFEVLLSAHKRELQKLHTNEVTNKVAYTQTSAIVHISIFKLAQH